MQAKIAVLAGDGIGPDVNAEAIKVLDAVASQFGHDFEYREGLVGGVSLDAHGVALTDETFELAEECDALLLGVLRLQGVLKFAHRGVDMHGLSDILHGFLRLESVAGNVGDGYFIPADEPLGG